MVGPRRYMVAMCDVGELPTWYELNCTVGVKIINKESDEDCIILFLEMGSKQSVESDDKLD